MRQLWYLFAGARVIACGWIALLFCSVVANAEMQSPQAIWSYPVDLVGSPPERLVVIGAKKSGTFMPTDVVVPEHPGTPASGHFPLQTNLLSMLAIRPFGEEERVTIARVDNSLLLTCRAGNSPAGAILSSPYHFFPVAMQGSLDIDGRGPSGIRFSMTGVGADAPPGGVAIGDQNMSASIPLNKNLADADRQVVVTCPANAAEAVLTSIRLEPRGRQGAARIGTWIWDLGEWLHDPVKLLTLARHERVSAVYLQLPIDDHPATGGEELTRLFETLIDGGIVVHAVEGDPDMIEGKGRTNAIARANALRRFRRSSHAGLSVQYDIEPYLRPDYRNDPERAWLEWAVTVNELSDTLEAKVSVVIPFWMRSAPGAEKALQAIKSSLSAVIVMAYRTDLNQIEQLAQDWLDWGAVNDVIVHIALENGPVATEIHRTYSRAPGGELVLDSSMSPSTVRLLSDRVTQSLTEAAYSFHHEVVVDSSRISFLGGRKALDAATARLEDNLSAWASFGGLMIHELFPPRGRIE